MVRRALADACAARPLDEKWLLAPTHSGGRQWVEGCARGAAIVNLRVHTVGSMAAELARGAMAAGGLARASDVACEMVVRRVWAAGGTGYLGRLGGAGAVRRVRRTLENLRMAGVPAGAVGKAKLEVAGKGKELGELLGAYEAELGRLGLLDGAGVLELAARNVAELRDVVVLVPEELELRGLEQKLVEAVPGNTKVLLAGEVGKPEVEAFRAGGEANEVRHVLRTCLERGWGLDEVEVLHTDPAYADLAYEVCQRYGVPVTFAEGVAALYSKAGRALAQWIRWRAEGYPAGRFVRMLRDGLLQGAGRAEAGVLAGLGVGFGRDRYEKRVADEATAVGKKVKKAEWPRDEHGVLVAGGEERLRRRLKSVAALKDVVGRVMDLTRDGARAVLEGAAEFVADVAAGDEECREELLGRIREARGAVEGDADVEAWEWLEELGREARVGAHGPRPGHLYVAPLAGGGQSGRAHTFVVGLDDGRFPGAGLQDPLLLDGERRALSGELPLEGERPSQRRERLTRVLEGLAGTVTLSYSCKDLEDGRELYPCAAFVGACREAWGLKDLDLDGVRARLTPQAFVAGNEAQCLDEGDWWLERLCGKRGGGKRLVGGRFKNLEAGWEAGAARASDRFTAWDGLVGADAWLDPTSKDGMVPSPSALVELGTCARKYFYRKVLGLAVEEELERDPALWLDAMEAGSLLHEVFQRFLEGIGRRPEKKDKRALEKTLDEVLREWREAVPPAGEAPYEVQVERFRKTCEIFLATEVEFCKTSTPRWFEVPIGVAPQGAAGQLDSPDPAQVVLPDKRRLRVRGRIDRIDETPDGYAVWDYKTGKAHLEYQQSPKSSGGSLVQHAVYRFMAEERLRAAVDKKARVDVTGYFFPSPDAQGMRIDFGKQYRDEELQVLGELADVAAAGAYPATDVKRKGFSICERCDYRSLCGDVEAVVRCGADKVGNASNRELAAWRKLRGI